MTSCTEAGRHVHLGRAVVDEQQPVAENTLGHNVQNREEDGLGVHVDLEVERTGSESTARGVHQ